MKINSLGAQATSVLAILAVVGAALGYMDTRHASAADLRVAKMNVAALIIDRYEAKIEELEDVINELSVKPILTPWEQTKLIKAQHRRDKYLRRLGRKVPGQER